MHPYLWTSHPSFSFPICRLGLATRGGTHLTVADVHAALDRGINFLNWCGQPDSLSSAVAGLGPRRRQVMVCVQLEARTAAAAETELRQILRALNSDYVDVLTFYYVERAEEWREIMAPGGALEFCRAAQRDGRVRLLGLTSHQRRLAATAAAGSHLELLMIRYNAAHRGAEQEVFPVTLPLQMPVAVYTCLRWGALTRATPDDPPGFSVPGAPHWYRFALRTPGVTVALMAPDNRQELEENLHVLELPPLSPAELEMLAAHGGRVRKHAGSFP